MIDELVGSAISVGEDKLQGEAVEEKTSAGSKVLRFFISLIWFAVTFVISLIAFLAMVGDGASKFLGGEESGGGLGFLAVGISLLVGIITFCVPYLRKKGSLTRWCGIVSLGDAAWWIYLLASN